MKNVYTFYFSLVILILGSFKANAQSDYFYYAKSQKVHLEKTIEYIHLYVDSEFTREKAESLAKTLNASVVEFIPDEMHKTVATVQVKDRALEYFVLLKLDAASAAQAISVLEKTPHVNKIMPYFMQGLGKTGLTRYISIKLKNINDGKVLDAFSARYNVEVLGYNKYNPLWYILSVPHTSKLDALQLANLYYESGLFEIAKPDFTREVHYSSAETVNNTVPPAFTADTYYADQWGLHNVGQGGGTSGTDVKAEEAWSITTGASTVKIAIYDSGYQTTHPDLSANNFGSGYNVVNAGPSVIVANHGTACAGIVGAVKDNNIGISGVAPGCKIVSISHGSLNPTDTEYAAGFYWAQSQGISVVSCSWFIPTDDPSLFPEFEAAVDFALDHNVVIVFASGNHNETSPEYPSAFDKRIITVGAMDRCGARAGQSYYSPDTCDPWPAGIADKASSYGKYLDVVAPGSSISTTDMVGDSGNNYNPVFNDYNSIAPNPIDATCRNYTKLFGGTSAACAYVAGIAGLVRSINPSLTAQEVHDIIGKSARKIRTDLYAYNTINTNGSWNTYMGYGLVDAYKAVKLACPANLTVTQSFASVPIDEKQASNQITASNSVESATTHIYHAGTAVVLTPGFLAKNGSSFSAYIAGCASNIASRMANPDSSQENADIDESLSVTDEITDTKGSIFKIYPNPAATRVTISTSAGVQSVLVTSLDGKTMFSREYKDKSTSVELDINGYAQGYYTVTVITTDGQVQTQKLIKN